MRTLLVITLLLFASGAAYAQQPIKLLRNYIGPMADLQLVTDFINTNVGGIQFRHQRSPMIAWRASVGYFNLKERGSDIHLYPFTDTIRTRRTDLVMNGIAISGGIEAQRQFYKKLYLYAGVDVRLGFAAAQQDTQLTYDYYDSTQALPILGPSHNVIYSSRSANSGNGIMVSTAVLLVHDCMQASGLLSVLSFQTLSTISTVNPVGMVPVAVK